MASSSCSSLASLLGRSKIPPELGNACSKVRKLIQQLARHGFGSWYAYVPTNAEEGPRPGATPPKSGEKEPKAQWGMEHPH